MHKIFHLNYMRFISLDDNTYFSDILSKSCIFYTHNKLLKEKNAFLIKDSFVHVNTIVGDKGINLDDNITNFITGIEVFLSNRTPNLQVVWYECGNYYKFKVGERFVRVSNNTITLTFFKKLGTKFEMNYVKIVECEKKENCKIWCLFDILTFGLLSKILSKRKNIIIK